MTTTVYHQHLIRNSWSSLCPFWILFCVSTLLIPCNGLSTYNNVSQLFVDKLGPNSGYDVRVRPIVDQTKPIQVNVTFDIISIVEVDNIQQTFIVNGFLGFFWIDEIIAWSLVDYGYAVIHPYPKQIWRPQAVLSNTMGNRDLFQDDYAPLLVYFTGHTSWFPGSLFPTSCKLNLYKYPFDRQTCFIDMLSMAMSNAELTYTPLTGKVGLNFFAKSGEWTVEDTSVEAIDLASLSSFRVTFHLRRLPGFFIMNILTPIVLMSMLNILVFIIPVESGEKISYGITVLLALTVFMSIVSSQLPRSSDSMPLVTIYLLVLSILSVCTVIVTILIVYIHHRDERETRHQKASANFKGFFHKFKLLSRTAQSFKQVDPVGGKKGMGDLHLSISDSNSPTEKKDVSFPTVTRVKSLQTEAKSQGEEDRQCAGVNRWKQIGKHIDFVSFVVFTLIWISVTIGFLVKISE